MINLTVNLKQESLPTTTTGPRLPHNRTWIPQVSGRRREASTLLSPDAPPAPSCFRSQNNRIMVWSALRGVQQNKLEGLLASAPSNLCFTVEKHKPTVGITDEPVLNFLLCLDSPKFHPAPMKSIVPLLSTSVKWNRPLCLVQPGEKELDDQKTAPEGLE